MLEITTVITSAISNFQIQLFLFWMLIILDAIPDTELWIGIQQCILLTCVISFHKLRVSENRVGVSETCVLRSTGGI